MALKTGAKGSPRMEDVTALISKKNYTRAIEVIREQLKINSHDPRLRLQLADVLVMAGKGPQAIMILDPLADEFAREGFAAKAISVLKKIQKIDPNRRDVDKRLASVIEEKQRVATVAPPAPSPGGFEIGMEEIGMELPMAGGAAAHEAPRRVVEPELNVPEPEPEPEPPAPEPPALEVDLEPEPEPQPPAAVPEKAVEEAPAFDFGPASAPALGEDPLPIAVELPAPVEDRDLILEDEDDFVEVQAEAEVEAEPEPEPVADPMSDTAFADELMSVFDEAFSGLAVGEGTPALDGPPQDTEAGNQIVVSPLFEHFSVDEMVAVIQGLKLMTFERGKVILKQGDKGDSLYMLTAGSVRVFMKKDGKQVKVGDLEEGAFFGEVSILTGKPRSATIVALADCELLELDRATLDEIVQKQPHVWDVMQEFAKERTARSS